MSSLFHCCVIVLLAALALYQNAAHAQAVACAPEMARVTSIQGEVQFQTSEDGGWRDANLDDVLCLGSVIRVGTFSRAALVFTDDSTLRLDQSTTLIIRGREAERRTWLEMLTGAIHFFSHRPRALGVETPFVNAAAEGTEFFVRVGEAEAHILMFEGVVLASNEAGELRLGPDDAALIRAGEKPIPEIVVRPRDAVAWAVHYPPVLSVLEDRGAPGAYSAPVKTALEWIDDNNYRYALRALDQVPDAARDVQNETLRAGIFLNIGRVAAAEAAIERALAINAEASDAYALRTILHVVRNDRALALRDANRAVKLAPASSAALIAQSYARQANFDLEGARDSLREASQKNPDDALVYARLAEIELSFADYDRANAAADQAISLAPDLARTQTVRGFSNLAAIDTDAARDSFKNAIELNSADPLPHLGQGLAKIRDGNLEEGRRDLEIAASLDPNNALIRSYLGKAYFEEKRGSKDATQFEIAKKLDPNDPTPWVYDAIRKQTENRPVEALRDLEKAIELNGNRAVYRSRLLLDQDRATRNVSLASIYSDLGFEQLGIREATMALLDDPSSSAAHLWLSNSYVDVPRRRIAQVSELLQAQLLQPVGSNPIQPVLGFADLDLITKNGPAYATFNEFTPLFTRDGVEFYANGVIGNDSTFGEELTVTGLSGQTSLSAGQFHYETNGFRDNNDLQHDIYTFFAQSDFSEKLSFQGEYRRRDTRRGDLERRIDLDAFDPTLRENISENVFRIGSRLTPAPGQVGLLSAIYSDRDDETSREIFGFEFETKRSTDVKQIETQYQKDLGHFHLIGGAGYVVSRSRLVRDVGATSLKVDAPDIYAMVRLKPTPMLDIVARLAYGDVDIKLGEGEGQERLGAQGLTPGFGLSWRPREAIRLRTAAGRTINHPFGANQTLQPTQLVGFNEQFDDFEGTRTDWVGLGIDAQPFKTVRLGAEAVLRRLARRRLFDEEAGPTYRNDAQRDDRAMVYLYWTPTDQISTSLELITEHYSARARDFPDVLKVRTTTTPMRIRYLSPRGWYATQQTTFIEQHVELPPEAGQLTERDSRGLLIDLALGYRLPQRRGAISLQVNNVLDKRLSFQDERFRTSGLESTERFYPSLSLIVRMNFYLGGEL